MTKPYAAGIMFRVGNKILLAKRGATAGDHPNEWATPGGHIEEGETAEQAARREVLEEMGRNYLGPLTPHRVDAGYVTYSARLSEEFTPTLNDENSAYMWAPLDGLPENMHPGTLTALSNPPIDEMQVAVAISTGALPSPTRIGEMCLYAIRITGTGTAYRTALDEYTFRPPENYLTSEFLARCYGLPVIYEHPEDATLNSEEYANRNVGSIMLPYIVEDLAEVWGIARIYDESTAILMDNIVMSTSPTVVFTPEETAVFEFADGEQILIEGRPGRLDHVALCQQGVWDKGLAPSGVKSDNVGVSEMSEEELKAKADAEAEKAKADADLKAKADADAEEDKKKADAEEAPAWAKSLISRLNKLEEKKADSMVAGNLPTDPMVTADKKPDAEVLSKADADKLRADMEELKKNQPRALSDSEREELSEAQAKADSVANAFGERASAPMAGETPLAYRRRLASKFKAHSKEYATIDLNAVADSALFGIIEKSIYADAQAAAFSPATIVPNQLRPIVRADATGRQITTYAGDPAATWAPFQLKARRVVAINK